MDSGCGAALAPVRLRVLASVVVVGHQRFLRETFFAALRASAGLILPVFAEDLIVRLERTVFEEDFALFAMAFHRWCATPPDLKGKRAGKGIHRWICSSPIRAG